MTSLTTSPSLTGATTPTSQVPTSLTVASTSVETPSEPVAGIVGGVLGGLLLVVILIVITYVMRAKMRNRNRVQPGFGAARSEGGVELTMDGGRLNDNHYDENPGGRLGKWEGEYRGGRLRGR